MTEPRADIVSRKDAAARGLDYYFTGKPCLRGHIAKRYISGSCMACKAEDRLHIDPAIIKEWRERNPEKCAEYKRRAKENRSYKEYYERTREKQIAKSSAWNAQNKERMNANAKKRRMANPDKYRTYARESYVRNREEILRRDREYRLRNVEKRREATKRWRRENPDKAQQTDRNKKASRKNAPGRITVAETVDIFRLQRGRCAWCRSKLDETKHLDHIIPISRGGSNLRTNAQFLCAPCNLTKHAQDPIDFARSQGRLL